MCAMRLFGLKLQKKLRITQTERVAVHTSVPYVKFGEIFFGLLVDIKITLKVNL